MVHPVLLVYDGQSQFNSQPGFAGEIVVHGVQVQVHGEPASAALFTTWIYAEVPGDNMQYTSSILQEISTERNRKNI